MSNSRPGGQIQPTIAIYVALQTVADHINMTFKFYFCASKYYFIHQISVYLNIPKSHQMIFLVTFLEITSVVNWC